MLYAHSNSTIESKISQQLGKRQEIYEIDIRKVKTLEDLDLIVIPDQQKVLLYSFQQLSYYKHLPTFLEECKAVDLLIQYAKLKDIEHVVLITYPGAYFNSGNLFLQHKGIIEQKFVSSEIPCTLLNMQIIVDKESNLSNIHQLFYDKDSAHYLIPKKQNQVVYSIDLFKLVQVIESAILCKNEGKFDVFTKISSLQSLLASSNIAIERISPTYLYFKSFLGTYMTSTMLEVFLLPLVSMQIFRTEKQFGIHLFDEQIDQESNSEQINIFYERKIAHTQGLLEGVFQFG